MPERATRRQELPVIEFQFRRVRRGSASAAAKPFGLLRAAERCVITIS
jgi:hypothetical protein